MFVERAVRGFQLERHRMGKAGHVTATFPKQIGVPAWRVPARYVIFNRYGRNSYVLSDKYQSCQNHRQGSTGTAGSQSESHNEDCIVSLPCPKWVLANYTKPNAGIEVYCVLIGLSGF